MENILNKDIFNDHDLDKLSPDYAPHNTVLRMQMRRTLVKDTHCHGVIRSTTWTRKSIRKNKDHYNINKEIIKLQQDFDSINLKNHLTLRKGFETIKAKSAVYTEISAADNKMDTNDDHNIFLPNFFDDDELEVRNDNEFKLNAKTKQVKQVKFYRDSRKTKKSEHSKSELLDLNKDINENNEDIFRVACMHKSSKSEHEHVSRSVFKNNISPINTDRPEGDLQKLLVMMTISSKPTKYEVQGEVETNDVEATNCGFIYNENDKLASSRTTDEEGFNNILSITPCKVQLNDKEKYLIEKYVGKWRNFVTNRKTFMDEQRQATLKSFFDKISRRKIDIDQLNEYENKAKKHLRDYNTYQHRYKVQKHIIALQKAKLEEQNRLIEELKYNKILEASRQSVDAMKEEIRRTYNEIDRQLKPKIKCLTKELKIPDIEEPELVLHCLKVPRFLQRMEKRAREREEKHALIRERRRQIEEDRIKMKQQAELVRAEMDKDEKMRRLKELKQKRKKERIETIRKKQWCERLRGLIVMADLHYEKTLMYKYGIAPLRKLVEIKKDNIEKARAHYKCQLKQNVFLHWMWYTEDMWFERNFKAEEFHRKTLLRKVFIGFRMIHRSIVLKKQVADDYYDLYITQLGFRMFCEAIVVIRKENEMKMQKAVMYHNCNLQFKAFTCWRTLPALNALQREQEARKARWREKVLQVVPDYTPPDDLLL